MNRGGVARYSIAACSKEGSSFSARRTVCTAPLAPISGIGFPQPVRVPGPPSPRSSDPESEEVRSANRASPPDPDAVSPPARAVGLTRSGGQPPGSRPARCSGSSGAGKRAIPGRATFSARPSPTSRRKDGSTKAGSTVAPSRARGFGKSIGDSARNFPTTCSGWRPPRPGSESRQSRSACRNVDQTAEATVSSHHVSVWTATVGPPRRRQVGTGET